MSFLVKDAERYALVAARKLLCRNGDADELQILEEGKAFELGEFSWSIPLILPLPLPVPAAASRRRKESPRATVATTATVRIIAC